ncbi:DUF4347 domain-containing protein [Shewanella halifaxensis]|uniref:DUF4347 domain-containing protein n=1 Tax=Shewanella halifaxensis TaxID=271098 RepID=UPI000D591ECF|nr:DUF4347 domain-containing protein [Shewanella halifaxensis]
MNPHHCKKAQSAYSTFNDSLTGLSLMSLFGEALSFKRQPKQFNLQQPHISAKSTCAELIKEIPLYWIVLLCLLLCVNSAQALERSAATANLSIEQRGLVSTEQESNLVIIDSSAEDVVDLLAQMTGDIHLLILDDHQEPFEQINQALAAEPLYSNLTIIAKASSAAIYLGGRWIDQHYLLEHQQALAVFASQFASNSQLLLYTTNLTKSHAGADFIGLFERLTQLQIDIIYMQGQHFEPLWVHSRRYQF